MKVVMVEPNKPAYITEIGDDYKSIHDAVGGLIEPIYFLHERGVVMVGNEEAKLLGMEGGSTMESLPDRFLSAAITARTSAL